MIRYREGKYADAAHDFEEALRLDPHSDLRHRNLGDAYQRLGQAARALTCYRRAAELAREQLQNDPRDTLTMAKLAVYEAKLHHPREASRLAAEALAKDPTNAEVLYRIAVTNALVGRPDAAVAFLAQALDHGYSIALARQDDDLAGLKQSPAYQKVLRRP
jgi:tetratricopeptide (TPR) repeat protein